MRYYNIIQKKKIWLTISGVMVGLSVIALILFGLNFGIDFTGGSLLEVRFLGERPTVSEVRDAVSDLELGSLVVQPAGESGMILRFQDTSEEKHQEILRKLEIGNWKLGDGSNKPEGIKQEPGANVESIKIEGENTEGLEIEIEEDKDENEILDTEATGTEAVSENGTEADNQISNFQFPISNIEELRFDSVGPSIGQELKRKSIYAIALVVVAIVLYIAWVFRKVSKPVASWKYGITAIIALFHDVIITMGIFAVLGEFLNVEINTPFVAAILTVLGYSVNDTIVVFDRLRENLPKSDEDFGGTVNASVNQTITRSINTSATTLLVLLSIMFFGGSSIKAFVLALAIGIFIGTYSSIFLASPILTIWEKIKR